MEDVVVRLVVETKPDGMNVGKVTEAKALAKEETLLYITEETRQCKDVVFSQLERFCELRGYSTRQYSCVI